MEAGDWFDKGYDWIMIGNYQKALECCNQAIELDPDYADAYFNKGVVLDQLGDYRAAIACFERVIALEPYNTMAYRGKEMALKESRKFFKRWRRKIRR